MGSRVPVPVPVPLALPSPPPMPCRALADAFAETLPQTIRDRGSVLERNGAWMVQPTSRSSTHQIRRR